MDAYLLKVTYSVEFSQGSILGPLLFLIYLNDSPNCLKFTAHCLYADDGQIVTSSFDIGVLANNINSDLQNLSVGSLLIRSNSTLSRLSYGCWVNRQFEY